MKFWLACFALLFVGAELLEWLAGQHSFWLVIGGLGLAAASNAAHLPKLDSSDKTEEAATPQVKPQTSKKRAEPLSVAEQSADDSISFKIRFPWQ